MDGVPSSIHEVKPKGTKSPIGVLTTQMKNVRPTGANHRSRLPVLSVSHKVESPLFPWQTKRSHERKMSCQPRQAIGLGYPYTDLYMSIDPQVRLSGVASVVEPVIKVPDVSMLYAPSQTSFAADSNSVAVMVNRLFSSSFPPLNDFRTRMY